MAHNPLNEIAAALENVEAKVAVVNIAFPQLMKRIETMAIDLTNLAREATEMRSAVALALAAIQTAKDALSAELAAQGATQAAVDAVTASLDEIAKPLEALAPPAEQPPADPIPPDTPAQ